MKYSDFVDYSKLDPFKEKITKFLAPTFENITPLNIKVVKQSLGEPAVLLDFTDKDFYLAFKSDGVGTKNKIADAMLNKNKNLEAKKLYSVFGIDLIAMNANDLICLGATPIALSDEIASGDSDWFEKEEVEGLLSGFKKGCDQAGITIPCGETPTLKDVVYPNTVNITGSMIGIVQPKSKAVWGQDLQAGDIIYGLASNGLHSNGATLARKIVEKLPQGYFTQLSTNKIVGEKLLKPTQIYVNPILEMIKKNLEIHYLSNITGSAFKKIMRAQKSFTYLINKLPSKPEVFKFLQEKGNVSNEEAYKTWNMGVGFTIFAPKKEEKEIKQICQKHQIEVFKLGFVKEGPKQVVIKPLDITYSR